MSGSSIRFSFDILHYMLTLYITSLIISILYTSLLFLLALKKKDNSIIDIAYGPGFIVTASVLSVLTLSVTPLSPFSVILLLCIYIWGTRLSYRIYKKNRNKPEDFRYATWREAWSKKGQLYVLVRSYLQIFVLQGVVISIVLLPFTLSLWGGSSAVTLLILGLALWVTGFMFEAIGDAQLDRFIQNKDPNKGTIMKSGLWKYTRHPNYFGESLMWWGLALVAFGGVATYFVFLSPLLITYLLTKVSGIPMLEKKWEGVPEWEAYKKQTSAFFPLPPKK